MLLMHASGPRHDAACTALQVPFTIWPNRFAVRTCCTRRPVFCAPFPAGSESEAVEGRMRLRMHVDEQPISLCCRAGLARTRLEFTLVEPSQPLTAPSHLCDGCGRGSANSCDTLMTLSGEPSDVRPPGKPAWTLHQRPMSTHKRPGAVSHPRGDPPPRLLLKARPYRPCRLMPFKSGRKGPVPRCVDVRSRAVSLHRHYTHSQTNTRTNESAPGSNSATHLAATSHPCEPYWLE